MDTFSIASISENPPCIHNGVLGERITILTISPTLTISPLFVFSCSRIRLSSGSTSSHSSFHPFIQIPKNKRLVINALVIGAEYVTHIHEKWFGRDAVILDVFADLCAS
ncbi:hypothetical protein VTN00DRAFT_5805 [Thermoascus crustaceus]|uniref:uncharacterized protein n=1 Tax=Thermoascus crustaceus TaxID=5088 RepID=UPI0037432691